ANFSDQVPAEVIAERRQRLRELERHEARKYYRSLVGRRLDVLVEGEDRHRPGHVVGTSCRYAPVSFRAHAPALLARVVPVRAEALVGDQLVGSPESAMFSQDGTREGKLALPL